MMSSITWKIIYVGDAGDRRIMVEGSRQYVLEVFEKRYAEFKSSYKIVSPQEYREMNWDF